MAHEIKVSTESANVKANAWATAMNSGIIRIYNGAKPATANTALGGQTLLGELTFGNPAFGAAVAGLVTANAITKDSSADNTGIAQFYRLFKSDGTTPMGDGTCGVTGGGFDLEMPNTSITQFGEITCTGFTHQESLG
jgi:hypothetical protein